MFSGGYCRAEQVADCSTLWAVWQNAKLPLHQRWSPFSHARGRDVSCVPSHHTVVAVPPRDQTSVCVSLELAPELITIVASLMICTPGAAQPVSVSRQTQISQHASQTCWLCTRYAAMHALSLMCAEKKLTVGSVNRPREREKTLLVYKHVRQAKQNEMIKRTIVKPSSTSLRKMRSIGMIHLEMLLYTTCAFSANFRGKYH